VKADKTTPEDTDKKNTASNDNYGHAVYYDASPAKKRNTTLGTGDTISTTTLPAASGASLGNWTKK
jgi:hypothetical protein